MSRIAIVVAAALALGAIVFTVVRPAPAPTELAATAGVAEMVAADAETAMRLCLGPARVTLGGEPFLGLAFGGDGCDMSAANLVGFRILRGPTVPSGPVLSFRVPGF